MKLNKLIAGLMVLGLSIPMMACSAPAKPAKTKASKAAASASAAEKTPKEIEALLAVKLPNQKVKHVQDAGFLGLYEVALEVGEIFYVDKTGQKMFFGEVVDVSSQNSLTEARKQEVFKIDFENLPLDKAIKVVRGDGSRKLAVYSDPDCYYCKKLDSDLLTKVDNVTVYYFMYPLDQLHPDARRKAKLIACSANPAQAWQDWMLTQKLPENSNETCGVPLDEFAANAAKARIRGTPGLVFPNGKMIPGALPLDQLEEALAQSQAQAAPKAK